jgi:hypothetical protein
MSLPSAIAELIDESIALERSGEVGIALQYARAALDAARASGECEAIAPADTPRAPTHCCSSACVLSRLMI